MQRVSQASVTVEGRRRSSIGTGLVVLAAFEEADTSEELAWVAGKIARLRVFDDGEGTMNRSVVDIGGDLLVVSQFTLFASTRKGNRPSYIRAARPETAIPLYEQFLQGLEREIGRPVQTGEFGAMMQVALLNEGPVTLIIDSKWRE